MTLEPLLSASLVVQIHLAAALVGLTLGAYQLAQPKGTPRHRLLGYIWVALLIGVSVSSFWIRGLMGGGFSPIHILSVLTLVTLTYAIWQIRRGNVRAHRYAMIGMYVGGMIGAGAGAVFAPGRMIPKMFGF